MEIVHFYKDGERVGSFWASSLKAAKENPRKYFSDYTEDMIITQKSYRYPVQDGDKIREATRAELVRLGVYIKLVEGEIIENGELIEKVKPSKYHKWNGTDWTVDIYEVKKLKRDELKAIRDKKINENIEVHGELFQVRSADMENFDDAERAVTRGVKNPNDIRHWILANNSIKPFTYEQIREVIDAKALRKEQLFIKFGELSMKLEKAQNIEEIEAILWEG